MNKTEPAPVMHKRPLVLVSPSIEAKGREFADISSSLSHNYERALLQAGMLPFTMPAAICSSVIEDCVEKCDGVLLTGGDDVDPRIYLGKIPPAARKTVEVTPDGGERDLRELLLIAEVFRQRKPLLAICRGHQMLNVALGGTLIADIANQLPKAQNHRRMDRRSDIVHEVELTQGSQLARIIGQRTLGVNSTHHQAVGRVARPLRISAASQDGVIEGLELASSSRDLLPFMLSVQFHPERLANRYPAHAAIFTAFARACHGRA